MNKTGNYNNDLLHSNNDISIFVGNNDYFGSQLNSKQNLDCTVLFQLGSFIKS